MLKALFSFLLEYILGKLKGTAPTVRDDNIQQGRLENAQQSSQLAATAAMEAKQVHDHSAGMSDADVAADLRDNWTRPD